MTCQKYPLSARFTFPEKMLMLFMVLYLGLGAHNYVISQRTFFCFFLILESEASHYRDAGRPGLSNNRPLYDPTSMIKLDLAVVVALAGLLW